MNSVKGLVASIVVAWPLAGGAYGTDGHLIAGIAAEPLLRACALRQLESLSSEPFAELGWWADRVRGEREHADSGPWHYMNVADDAELDRYRHPPEGDVLWAIEHFADVLADPRSGDGDREEALKFLVHFVVDVHQPLHVGRAGDRGGNRINVRYDGDTVNLHRFWDTDAIRLAGLSPRRYARALAPQVAAVPARQSAFDPEAWAEESLELRATVYAYDASRQLDAGYITDAVRVTEARLVLAAARLAATLNRLLCTDADTR